MRVWGCLAAMAVILCVGGCSRSPASHATAKDTQHHAWKLVKVSGDVAIFVDNDSVQQTDDDGATFETLVLYPDSIKEADGLVSYSVRQESISCNTQTHITRSETLYAPDGSQMSETDLAVKEQTAAVGSNGYPLYLGACQNQFLDENVFGDDQSAVTFGRTWARAFTHPPAIMANASAWAKSNVPPPTVTDLTPPTASLVQVAVAPGQGAFVEPASIQRQGDKATAVVVWVDRQRSVFGEDQSALSVIRFRFDCAANTMSALGSMTFASSGKLLVWTSRDAHGTRIYDPTDRDGRTEGAACGRLDLQRLPTFDGSAAAEAHVARTVR
jgi:hypothetical protein